MILSKKVNNILFLLALVSISFFAFDPQRLVDNMVLPQYDYIKHIFAFFILSYFFIHGFEQIRLNVKVAILLCLIVLIEIIQIPVGRDGSIKDILSGVLGIVLYFIFKIIVNYKKDFFKMLKIN